MIGRSTQIRSDTIVLLRMASLYRRAGGVMGDVS